MSVQKFGRFTNYLDVNDYNISNSGITTKTGDIVLNPFTNNVVIAQGKRIKYDIPPGVFNDTDLVNKGYVDGVAQGFVAKDGCRVITLVNLNVVVAGSLATKTLTAAVNGVAVIDGVTLLMGDRVLVAGQTNRVDNGIYYVSNAGSATTKYVLTRDADANATSELNKGAHTFILEGTNVNTGWVLQGPFGNFVLDDATFGTQYWVIFSRAGQALGSQLITSGTNSANVYKETVDGRLLFRNLTSSNTLNTTYPIEFSDSGNSVVAGIDTTKITSVGALASGSIVDGFGDITALSLTSKSNLNFTANTAKVQYKGSDYLTLTGTGISSGVNISSPDAALDTHLSTYGQLLTKSAKDSVKAVLTGTYNITNAQTLTAPTNGVISAGDFDGVSLVLNDRVLVRTLGAGNGIYYVSNAGSVSAPVVLTRANDANTSTKIDKAYVVVTYGTIYARGAFQLLNTGVIGSDITSVTRLFAESTFENIMITTSNGYLQFPDLTTFKIKSATSNFLTFDSSLNRLAVGTPVDLLDVKFAGTTNKITLPSGQLAALYIENSSNDTYLTFDTLNAKLIAGATVVLPSVQFNDDLIFRNAANQPVLTLGNVGGNITVHNGVNFAGSQIAVTNPAFEFSLSPGVNQTFNFLDTNNLKNFIAYTSFNNVNNTQPSLTLGETGIDVNIKGNLTLPSINFTGPNFTLKSNLASALHFVDDAAVSYLKFITTTGAQQVEVNKTIKLTGDVDFQGTYALKRSGVSQVSLGLNETTLSQALKYTGATSTYTNAHTVNVSTNGFKFIDSINQNVFAYGPGGIELGSANFQSDIYVTANYMEINSDILALNRGNGVNTTLQFTGATSFISYNNSISVGSNTGEIVAFNMNDATFSKPLILNATTTTINNAHTIALGADLTITRNATNYLKVNGTNGQIELTATKFNSSITYNVTEISSSITLGLTHGVVNVTTGASDVVITLPVASTVVGRMYKIAKVDSGVGRVLIRRSGSDLLDGTATDVELLAQYDHTGVISHGGLNWLIH